MFDLPPVDPRQESGGLRSGASTEPNQGRSQTSWVLLWCDSLCVRCTHSLLALEVGAGVCVCAGGGVGGGFLAEEGAVTVSGGGQMIDSDPN